MINRKCFYLTEGKLYLPLHIHHKNRLFSRVLITIQSRVYMLPGEAREAGKKPTPLTGMTERRRNEETN